MEDLYRLSECCAKIGALNCSIEVDYERYKHYLNTIEEHLKYMVSVKCIYENKDDPHKPLGFTIIVRGIKIYISCPTIKFEETNNL